MMPDKVYVRKEKNNVVYSLELQYNNRAEEYIRKGALLEWLRKTKDEALNEVPMLDVLTLQKVIDKLNKI